MKYASSVNFLFPIGAGSYGGRGRAAGDVWMGTGQPGCSPPPSTATRQHVASLVTGDHTGLASRYIPFISLFRGVVAYCLSLQSLFISWTISSVHCMAIGCGKEKSVSHQCIVFASQPVQTERCGGLGWIELLRQLLGCWWWQPTLQLPQLARRSGRAGRCVAGTGRLVHWRLDS